MKRRNRKNPETNPDPLTGEPGSHPIGTGLGAAGGGMAAGAAAGAVAGPLGSAAGVVVGGIAGGLAGKRVAEKINPTHEESYWEKNYASRPYVKKDQPYEDYKPAYQSGIKGYEEHCDTCQNFDEAEPHIQQSYEKEKGLTLSWKEARPAAKDAWDKLERNRSENKDFEDLDREADEEDVRAAEARDYEEDPDRRHNQ